MQTSRVRPTGITLLVVLEVIIAILLLIGGIAIAALGPFIREAIRRTVPMPGIITESFFIFIGLILIILGLVGLGVSWGLWTGQGWAWTLAFVLAVIGAILNLLSLPGGIVGLVIYGLIAWYLWQPHVKAYYGMGPAVTVPPLPQPPPPPPGTVIYCSKCGAANPIDSKFCKNCGSELKA